MVGLFITLLLVSCSNNNEKSTAKEVKPKKESEVKKEEVVEKETYKPKEIEYYELENTARELTEYEKGLLRKPGVYSGDSYSEKKVNEEIDKLPSDLTGEQYLNELLYLLAEDYHKEVETFVNFNSNVDVNIARPDGDVDKPTLKKAHYAILMDASGSMKAEVGGKPRFKVAKEAVNEFAGQVPEGATVSLRMYGHKGSGSDADKELSCTSTESFYNGAYDADKFEKALDKVSPAGWTPIALALNKVKEDIPKDAGQVVVYVVSDGIGTCGGDSVKEAKTLVDADIQTVVNIIGFDVDNEGQRLLKKVADAGNGEFTYVDSERQLKEYMHEQYEEIQEQWYEWKQAGKEKAYDLKGKKKDLAYDTKKDMKEKSRQAKKRLKDAQEYLENRFEDDYSHPSRDTRSLIIDHCNGIWGYAVDIGNKLWGESVDSGNEEWGDFVDEGNEKIDEAREKKNEQ